MPSKPLLIDLYCGLELLEAKLARCAYPLIDQAVARRTKHPNHVALAILHFPAGVHPSEVWSVCDLHNAVFPARLAGARKIGIFPVKPLDNGISSTPAFVIDGLNMGFALVKIAALTLTSLLCADLRAVAAIGSRGLNTEMCVTNLAIATLLGYVSLLASTTPPLSTRTCMRTIEPIGSFRFIFAAARRA